MIDTVIVSGGMIQEDFALDFLEKIIKQAGREHLYLMAADKGLDFFRTAALDRGILPDIAVGDFDSLTKEGKEYLEHAPGMEIRRLKPEKDDSDTQSAAVLAMERGSREIAILGATGSRLDHVLANLELLSLGRERGVSMILVDANNYIRLIESGTVLKRSSQFGTYVSFFPVGGDVTGLTLRGFRYPLTRHHLRVSDSGLTVSNEIRGETAQVTYESGSLLMIMSRD